MDNDSQLDILQAILNQVSKNDPNLKEFIEEQIQNSKHKEKQEEISKEIIRCLRIQNKKLLEQVDTLKKKLKHRNADRDGISNKLSELMKLNSSLSEALDAAIIVKDKILVVAIIPKVSPAGET